MCSVVYSVFTKVYSGRSDPERSAANRGETPITPTNKYTHNTHTNSNTGDIHSELVLFLTENPTVREYKCFAYIN